MKNMDPQSDELVIVRRRFLQLSDSLAAVQGLLDAGATAFGPVKAHWRDIESRRLETAIEELHTRDLHVALGQMGGLAANRPLDADVVLPDVGENFWHSPRALPCLVPIAALVFGQALFEAFLLDLMALLSRSRSLPAVPRLSGLRSVLKELKRRFNVEIEAESLTRLLELSNTRNLWIHGGGVVTAEYLAKSKEIYEVGELRDVREHFVEWALWSFDDAARQLLRQLFGAAAFVEAREPLVTRLPTDVVAGAQLAHRVQRLSVIANEALSLLHG